MNVFLDLDGTLSDPLEGIARSVAYALERLGHVCPPPEDLGWLIGPPLLGSFERLGVADPHEALALYRERYQGLGLFENSLYSGMNESLSCLRKQGCRLFLATAKPIVYARRITAHFGLSDFFEQEFGPGLDGSLNDKADLLAHALRTSGADPARSVMVGDRLHDYRAAKANGMKSLAVSWGYGGPDEAALADAVCHHVSDLPSEVIGLLGG